MAGACAARATSRRSCRVVSSSHSAHGHTSGPNSPCSMAAALFDASPADLTGNRQLAEVRPRHFNLATHRFR
ncbi:hypothetical protein C6T66_14870 [Burkholderia multivorans]|uniref:Uncharacterized protein n=1 Tax=Burkholderia multivorans TaxID=87883 RepID=A0A8E2RXH2_9BURK|nr:hypothetical protein C6P76_11270 [Burkholderia multivorans]PRF25453.1 hypothetical protein C6P98_08340 [Burkholderia multivorans]PRG86316.1 hypothetical protein C6T66_14870 [Burkholderia multivorans]